MTEEKVYIVTSFYEDDSVYPNMRGLSKSQRKKIYWENVYVMMRTINLFGDIKQDCEFVIFTNSSPPDKVRQQLSEIDVKILNIPFNFNPPSGYWNTFNGAFYLLDAMTYMSNIASSRDVLLFIDPDCVVVGSLVTIIDKIRSGKAVVYQIDLSPDESMNGMSISELEDLAYEIDSEGIAIKYYGGEFYGFNNESLKKVCELVLRAWPISLQRFYKSESKFNTEEHILSYVLSRVLLSSESADQWIRRIWTAAIYNDVKQDDLNLTIWHLPSEKKRGIRRLYKLLSSQHESMSADQFRYKAARVVGIRSSLGRHIRDTAVRSVKSASVFKK